MSPTILHLGTGSFHRAHQAWYLHRMNEKLPADAPEEKRWKLVCGNIRNDMNAVMDLLKEQNCTYTLEIIDTDGKKSYETIRSIHKIIGWSPDLHEVIEAGADTECRIITFTVTEGGYYLDAQDRLLIKHPDILADIKGGVGTIYGAIAAILEQRAQRGAEGAISLMSCDNLRRNSERFKTGMAEFLARSGKNELLAWFEQYTACPCSMVDRLTPRPSAEVVKRVKEATGVQDPCAVMSEAFALWFIEDNFPTGRPDWDKGGAVFVADARPYLEAKIRVLNAGHSCAAWAGALAGYSFIHEALQDKDIHKMSYDYITHDAIPCITPCPLDLEWFRDAFFDRFGHEHIPDRLERVTLNGYEKVQGFVSSTVKDCIEGGRKPAATGVMLALFLRYLGLWVEGKLPFEHHEADLSKDEAREMVEAADQAKAFAGQQKTWGGQAGHPLLEEAIREGLVKVDAWLDARKGRK